MKKGLCNICGTAGPLTEDHIFPLSTVPFDLLEVRGLAEHLSCNPSKPRSARGSVARRTICGNCNSKRLGSRYDPHFKDFAERVASWVNAKYQQDLTLPANFSIQLKPNRVLRAIIGHLLAAESRPRRHAPLVRAPMPDGMREFFLDETKELPPNLEVFCWPYPSETQVIIRGAGIGHYGYKHFITSDFMKAFPLGYWLVWDRDDSISIPLCRMPSTKSIDEERSVELSFQNVPRVDWPENPTDYEMLLENESMTILCQKQTV